MSRKNGKKLLIAVAVGAVVVKADSLDLFEMVMALEENYGIEIPTDDLGQLETVADVIDYIQSHKE